MNLPEMIKSIALRPKETWPKLKDEPATMGTLYGYALLLAAFPTAAKLIGINPIGSPMMEVSFGSFSVSYFWKVANYARAQGIAFTNPVALRTDPRIVALINAEVEERNRHFASFETIKKVALVEEFTIDNGLLTLTLKVRRAQGTERYRDVIEAMYRED